MAWRKAGGGQWCRQITPRRTRTVRQAEIATAVCQHIGADPIAATPAAISPSGPDECGEGALCT